MARIRMTSIVRQVRHSVRTIALLMLLPVIAGLVKARLLVLMTSTEGIYREKGNPDSLVRDVTGKTYEEVEKKIRELQNCNEKAVILSESGNLSAGDIRTETQARQGGAAVPSDDEEKRVREAMSRAGGNISAAAKMLGVSRPTFYAKLKKYGL